MAKVAIVFPGTPEFDAAMASGTLVVGAEVEAARKKHDVEGPDEQQPSADAEQQVPARAAGGRVNPDNINHEPSEAQKEAGNYKKDRLHLHGLEIVIENAKDSMRRGVSPDGTAWACKQPCHYGYFSREAAGADDDKVDVYLGPHTASKQVFVMDQVHPETKLFDEHKVGLGFGSEKQFLETYKRAFSDGKGAARVGAVHALSLDELKRWLRSGGTTQQFNLPDKGIQ